MPLSLFPKSKKRAALDLNLVTPGAAFDSRGTFSRAAAAVNVDSTGSFVTAASGAPRIGYDPETLKPHGLLIEQARQNGTRNASATGYTAGVVGSGGAWPTNWNTTNSQSGATWTIVGPVTNGGIPCFRFRLQATAPASGAYILNFEKADATNPFTTTVGDVCYASAYVALSSGSLTNVVAPSLSVIERTSGGTFSASATLTADWLSDRPRRFYSKRTIVNAGTANCALSFTVVSGNSIDLTVDVAYPNITKNLLLSSLVDNTSIPAETATFPLSAVGLSSATALSMVVSGSSPRFAASGVLAQLDDGSENNRITVRRSTSNAFLTVVASGSTVADVDLGSWPATTSGVVALSATANGFYGSFNGRPFGSSTSGAMPAVTTARLGCDSGGTNYWNSTIQRLTLHSGAKGSAWTQANSIPGALSDGFHRADGAPAVTPDGRFTWLRVPAGTSQVLALISSNALVTADSGSALTASYTGANIGGTTQRLVIRNTFSAATTGGDITIIGEANGVSAVTDVTNGAVHISFTDTTAIVSFFSGGSQTILKNLTYATACTRDGATAYQFGWRLVGDTIRIELPDGSYRYVTDTRLAPLNGKYAIFESFWSTGQTQTVILDAYAEAA